MASRIKKTDNDYLTGKLLLATPSMGDTRFERAVIYVCSHSENGAMGIVINQYAKGVTFPDLLEQLEITPDDVTNRISLPVFHGGPLEMARGFILHTEDYHSNDTVTIDEHISLTGTLDMLKDMAVGKGPEHSLFALGYAGWGAGQLDDEMLDNAWMMVDADPDIIFDTRADKKWEKALSKIGIDPMLLSMTAGQA